MVEEQQNSSRFDDAILRRRHGGGGLLKGTFELNKSVSNIRGSNKKERGILDQLEKEKETGNNILKKEED